MQTMAMVLMVWERSRSSKLIMDLPRCVSHSSHACKHDRQPMQREGSI
jgi:hypothetical protein